MTRTISLCLFTCLFFCGTSSAQQARYDDVVRNLRNPDPKVRFSAVRLLRESKYPESAIPVSALIADPVDAIQLEALAAELSLFLVNDVPDKKRVALLVEVRNAGRAEAAFDMGPLAVRPQPVPPELVRALLQAVDDDTQKVRVEAIYTLGTIARPPIAEDSTLQLVKALDHYDPAIRAGAARVIGRLALKSASGPLIKAMNDSSSDVRFAAMRALGAIHDDLAITALTEQLNYYGKGEGAWSALSALALIAHPSSVPVFKAHFADKDPFMRRAAAEGLGRAGDDSEVSELEIGAGNDNDTMVRAAMAFALQKLGRHYVPRLVEFMTRPKMVPQIADYLVELGPSITPALLPLLQDTDPAIRSGVVEALGAIGGPGAATAVQPLAQDHDQEVAQSAARALERLKGIQP
jgi:HEAT repeat protein